MITKPRLNLETGEVEILELVGDELAEHEANIANGPAIRAEILKAEIVFATETQLNAFAAARGYDGILSACTYATSTVPQFAAEGQCCVALRDATWAALYQMLAEVEAGTRPIPAGFDEIAAELPTAAAVWPD